MILLLKPPNWRSVEVQNCTPSLDQAAAELATSEVGSNQYTKGGVSRDTPSLTLDEAAAAGLATLKNGEVGKGRPRIGVSNDTSTLDEAADLLKVGHASVERAKKVIEHGAPALVEACERGDVACRLLAGPGIMGQRWKSFCQPF